MKNSEAGITGMLGSVKPWVKYIIKGSERERRQNGEELCIRNSPVSFM